MAENTTDAPRISEMLRITTENTSLLYQQIADHIDKLEDIIANLTQENNELKEKLNADN